MDPVNERRLRPIYDFIDTGNYKKALSEADKVLKKQKNFSCAKVLKSLALLRLNRITDAETVLDEVRSTDPTEDATLQAMTTFYRDTHQPLMIVDMYEKAIAKDPTNEELYSHLFMSYVRVGDYIKQQKTAQNLYKLKPINPYYFWSVVSSYLQAVDASNSPDTKQLLLKLSEKKVEKLISEGKIEQEAEVELYLLILEAQEKYEDMIRVMEGPLGKFIRNAPFLTYRKAQLHQKLRQNEAAFHLLQSLLDGNPDQLPYYLGLITLAIELDSERSEARHLLHVLDLLNNQIARNAKSKVRAPYLAKIELRYQVELHDAFKFDTQPFISSIGPVTRLIDELYTEFGHKMPFYLDIGYLDSKYPSFIDECAKWLHDLQSPLKSYDAEVNSPDEMKRNFSLLLLDHHLNASHRNLESLGKLVQLYYKNLKYGENLPSSDINPSDFYALIGISCVVEGVREHREDAFALVALCRKFLNLSPSNHTIKFILIFLLNSIGAASLASCVFNTLETKYIQMDTLDYAISRSLLSLGQIDLSLKLSQSSDKFYYRTCRDTNDYTFSCYKFGSFGKIAEINEVRSRIKNSLQYLVSRVDLLLARLTLELNDAVVSKVCNDLKETSATFPSIQQLVDNRDLRTFGVLPLHLQLELDQWKDYSFPLDSHWYMIRSKLIASIVKLHELNEDKTPENALSFKAIVDELVELEAKTAPLVMSSSDKFRLSPYTPRVITFLKGNYLNVLINCLNQVSAQYDETIASATSVHDGSRTNGDSPSCSSREKSTVELEPCLDAIIARGCLISVETAPCILEELVNFVETITFVTTYLWIVCSPKKSSASSGGRRKKKTLADANCVSPCAHLITSVKDTLLKCLSHVKSLSIKEEQPNNRLKSFIGDTIELFEDEIWLDIRQSWRRSIDQMIKIIESKSQMLLSLSGI